MTVVISENGMKDIRQCRQTGQKVPELQHRPRLPILQPLRKSKLVDQLSQISRSGSVKDRQGDTKHEQPFWHLV